MQLPGVKYNLAHGFPDDQPSSKLERIIITNHLKDNQYDLVINQTWGFLEYQNPVTKEPSDKFKICEYLVSNKLANKVLFFNFVDPIYDLSTWYEVFDACKKANKDFKLNSNILLPFGQCSSVTISKTTAKMRRIQTILITSSFVTTGSHTGTDKCYTTK